MKIISGGQTGVDRATLDAAIAYGIPHGGWCPRGRRAGDGTLDIKYQLQETESSGYRERTRRNVAESDGTLILFWEELSGGSRLTQTFAQKLNKPCLTLSLSEAEEPKHQALLQWVTQFDIRVLNVAGPSEKSHPGIYGAAYPCLCRLLVSLAEVES